MIIKVKNVIDIFLFLTEMPSFFSAPLNTKLDLKHTKDNFWQQTIKVI